MWAAIQKPICRWNGACDGGSHAAVRPLRPVLLPPSCRQDGTSRPQQARGTLTFCSGVSYVGI